MGLNRRNPTLSEDLISEILFRVPVKSLLCFQSVCKTWLSLIKHSAFVKSQLHHAITTQTNQTLIMYWSIYGTQEKFSILDADSCQIVADLKFPWSRGELHNYTVVGSANGIVCVSVTAKLETSVYLWNPAIRQYKVIPLYSVCYEIFEEALGFGFDEVDHDFKVIRVVRFGSPPSFCFEVYSDNRNTWRKVPDRVDIPCSGDFDVCVNGFLCGIGEHGMMAFDLNKEVLNCSIKLPGTSDDDDARIIEFNNSVALIEMIRIMNYGNTNWRLEDKINVWTLNDDACLRGGGVEASWTPVCSIDIVLAYLDMVAPMVHGHFSKMNLLLLIMNENYRYEWISCDVNKKEAKIVPLSVDMANHDYIRQIYKYTESLVSLAGFKQVNWNAGEDDN